MSEEEQEEKKSLRDKIKERVQNYQYEKRITEENKSRERAQRIEEKREQLNRLETEASQRKEERELTSKIVSAKIRSSPAYPFIKPFQKLASPENRKKFVKATLKEVSELGGGGRARQPRRTRRKRYISQRPQQYYEDFNVVMRPPYNPVEENLKRELFGSPLSKKQRKALGV